METTYSAHVYADGWCCMPSMFKFEAESVEDAKAQAVEVAKSAKNRLYWGSTTRACTELIVLKVVNDKYGYDQTPIAHHDENGWGPVIRRWR